MRRRVTALTLVAALSGVLPAGVASERKDARSSGSERTSDSAALTQGCIEKEWGYRCTYGPFLVTPETEQDIDFVPTPPVPGYITSMYATLVRPNGKPVARHAAHLHHAVWGNPNRSDLTCTNYPFNTLDRFFAAGKERTRIELPEGFGYYWDAQPPPGYPSAPPTWAMIHHLMGMHEGQTKEVFVQLDLGFVPASEKTLTDITPLWLDVRNCGTSEYDIAKNAGTGKVHKEIWEYPLTTGGDIVALGGHLHDGGIKLRLDNATAGSKLFVSRAIYDGKGRTDLRAMTAFSGSPGKRVEAGDVLRLTSVYDSSRKRHGAMGIMIGAIVLD